MKPAHTHDKFFKSTFSRKEEAIDLISHVLPKEMVGKLDFATLEADGNSYVSKELKEHFSDLVFNCKYAGRIQIKIAILLEHKSTVPDYPHLQLLKYFIGIWDQNFR